MNNIYINNFSEIIFKNQKKKEIKMKLFIYAIFAIVLIANAVS